MKNIDFISIFSSAKLLVATGFPWLEGVYTEIIDIGNPDMICLAGDTAPVFSRGCTGGLIRNEVLICGCIQADHYDEETDTWDEEETDTCWVLGDHLVLGFHMTYKRDFSSSIVINNKVSIY